MNVNREIERHRLPCGPATIGIESVCKKRLRDTFDMMLDRLTKETHPEGMDMKRAKLISDGKMKVEAKQEVDKYKEELQGNSKLLQDTSGKINTR
jgi:hypothetical protein